MKTTVELLTEDKLVWPLVSNEQQPHYMIESGPYFRVVSVDPFPAYWADANQVTDLVAACDEKFPLVGVQQANLYILSHEFASRLNGMTFEDSLYSIKESVKDYTGCKMLWRKRERWPFS